MESQISLKLGVLLIFFKLGLLAIFILSSDAHGGEKTTQPSYAGSWSSTCNNTSGIFSKTVDKASATDSSSATTYYSTPSCAEGSEDIRITKVMSIVDKGPDPNVQGAQRIRVIFGFVQITPLSAEMVAYMNNYEVCGFTDWTESETKDVTGIIAGGCAGHSAPMTGAAMNTLVRVDTDAIPNTLSLGDETTCLGRCTGINDFPIMMKDSGIKTRE